MSVRARSRTRRLVLLAATLLLVGGTAVWYLVRERRRDDEARLARSQGLAAYESGDYARAADRLGAFLRRANLDPDATTLLRYAQAVLSLERVKAPHLRSAMAQLRRCVALEPENAEARRLLLSVYEQVGLRTEALDQCEWLLARSPSDLDLRRAQARLLYGMGRYEEALKQLDGFLDPTVRLLEDQVRYVDLLARLGRPPEAILGRTEAVEAASTAADPRFSLVGACARLLTGDVAGARERLAALTGRAQGDEELARLLLPVLERAGLYGPLLGVLETIPPLRLGSDLQSLLVRRLWEERRPAAIPDAVAAWGEAPADLPTVVLGYQVLALERLGRAAEAVPYQKELEDRPEQAWARGWVHVLAATHHGASGAPRARIDAALAATETDAENPQAWFELGLAWRDAVETELALRAFVHAARVAPAWPEPPLAGMALLVRTGRLPDAVAAAEAAAQRGTDDPLVGILLQATSALRDDRDAAPLAQRLLTGLLGSTLPPSTTAPLRLSLLAMLRRTDDVRAALDELLAAEAVPPGDVLLEAAALSRSLELGLEGRCLDRYEAEHGLTPELAAARAHADLARGDSAASLAAFRARRQGAADPGTVAWQVAEARLLEEAGRPEESLVAWHVLAEQPDLPAGALHGLLRSAATASDPALRARATALLRALTGDGGVWWRVFQARQALAAPPGDDAGLQVALRQLEDVLRLFPDLTEARLLLAAVRERRGEPLTAIEVLQAAQPSLEGSLAAEVALARLLLAQGNVAAAREAAARFDRPGRADFATLVEAASLRGRLGDRAGLLRIAERLAEGVADGSQAEQLARLYVSVGELDRAGPWLARALEGAGSADPRRLVLAATVAHFLGRPAEADARIGRLAEVVPTGAERERLQAAYFRGIGDVAQARRLLEAALELDPGRPADWYDLLALEVSQGDAAAVRGTVARLPWKDALPDGRAPPAADLLAGAAEQADLRELATVYLGAEDARTRSDAKEALTVLLGPDGVDRRRLRALAEAQPGVLAVQMAVGGRLRRLGEGEAAVALYRTAMDRFPVEPAPAEALARLLRDRVDAARARYLLREVRASRQAAYAAGQAWRDRTLGSARDADLFLAALEPPSDALPRLEPYAEGAVRAGASDLLGAYLSALVVTDHLERAEEVLAEAVGRNAALADLAVRLAPQAAGRGGSDVARRWLVWPTVQEAARKDPAKRIDLAAAWARIASQGGGASDADEARRWLREGGEGLLDTPQLAEQVGGVYEALGDLPAAEGAYRRALSSGAALPVAANNLAVLLLRSGGVDEAADLAEKAVGWAPLLAEAWDTLGAVRTAQARHAEAADAFRRALDLEPGNPRRALRRAQALATAGDAPGAREQIENFKASNPGTPLTGEIEAEWRALERTLGVAPGR